MGHAGSDAELDNFVDTMTARLASFDRTSLASAKSMVNRASLPPDTDLAAAYGQFAHSLTLPGFLTRAAGAEALAAEKGLDFEYRMGEYMASPTSRPDPCPAGAHRVGPPRRTVMGQR